MPRNLFSKILKANIYYWMVGEKNYVLFKTRITVNMRDLDLRGAWGLGIFALRGRKEFFYCT